MNSPRQFRFVAVRTQSGEAVIRPLLPLVLTSPVNQLTVQGLLDTGADVNVLPYSMGIALGLDWDKQTIAVGLSGNLAHSEARAVLLQATLEPFQPATLALAWTRADHLPLILGQVNFFQAFNVCFYRSSGVFEVSPNVSP